MAREAASEEDVTRNAGEELGGVVAAARARMARIEGRAMLRRHALWTVAAGAIAALSRPILWPAAGASPLWIGFVRALFLFAAGLAAAAVALVIAGRSRRPSGIAAARAVDHALGLADVIASGFAFEQAGRAEPVVLLARRHAGDAAAVLDIETTFPLPSLCRAGREPATSGTRAAAKQREARREPAIDETEQALDRARHVGNRLREGLRGVILGQDDVVTGVVLALLAGGHVLLEGAPGLGKAQIARTLSKLCGGTSARIQLTPDLAPGDVLGTAQGGKGPIFANLVLADEIDRAAPRTRSALLEAMAERTVAVEGKERELPSPFFVLATEDPSEVQGVSTMPEAELDRFLLKLVVRMPDLDTLATIGARAEEPRLGPVTFPEELCEVQAAVRSIPSAPHVERFAARLVLATHAHEAVRRGAGPRAAQALMACGRARALLDGRFAVSVADVAAIAPHVLRHRIGLRGEAEAQGLDPERVVAQIVASTKA